MSLILKNYIKYFINLLVWKFLSIIKKMKKRKKKTNQNTDRLASADTLRNNTGRPWPLTPKAGVTLNRRRYQLGGYVR